MKHMLVGTSLLLILAFPSVRVFLESNMIGTMVVQIPLLIVCGYLLGKGLQPRLTAFFQLFNETGIPGILIVIFIVIFWSLPRSIDVALLHPLMELLKYVSLPLLAGIPLYYSWQALHTIGKRL